MNDDLAGSSSDRYFSEATINSSNIRRYISGAKKRINDDIRKAGEDDSASILVAQKEAFCSVLRRIGEYKVPGFKRIDAIRRELFRINERLPALATRLQFEEALLRNDFVVVVGDNGSGKSTQLPQYIVDMPEFYGKKVLCTQPRRIAAVTLAQRVAFEYAAGNEKIGKLGYFVGFEIGGLVCKSDKLTCIEYLTVGILVRQLAELLLTGDRTNETRREMLLDECSVVVVDEVHERNLNTDMLLGLLKLTKNMFPKLKVVVSSATMDATKFSTYFGDCPIINIPGRCFPVEIRYEPKEFDSRYKDLPEKVADKALEIVSSTPDDPSGGILCFVTGKMDIENALARFCRGLNENQRKNVVAYGLFGKQTPEEQQQAFEELKHTQRKVVFATDVAETSITVTGIRYVVDCGLSKDQYFSGVDGERSFPISAISKSSAKQRAGRAGRLSPGICYRLYSETEFSEMTDFPVPEVWRKPLGTAVTTLISIGQDPFQFAWPDRPPEDVLRLTLDNLRLLGVIDDVTCRITDVGRTVVSLQMDPDICRLLHHACKQGIPVVGAKIAALMRVNTSVFRKNSVASWNFHSPGGDLVSAYRAFDAWLAVKNANNEQKDANNEELTSAMVQNDDITAEKDEEIDEDWSELVTAYESDGEDCPPLPPVDNKIVVPDITLIDALPTPKVLRDWSAENGINCSIMVLANLEFQMILRRLQSNLFLDLEQLEPNNHDEVTDEQLQRLILQAMFLKTAVFEIVPSPFVPLHFEQRYFIPMSNCVANLGNNSVVTSLSSTYIKPPCIVFYEAFRGSDRLFLDSVTPIDPRWLVEDCPEFYVKLMAQIRLQAMYESLYNGQSFYR